MVVTGSLLSFEIPQPVGFTAGLEEYSHTFPFISAGGAMGLKLKPSILSLNASL